MRRVLDRKRAQTLYTFIENSALVVRGGGDEVLLIYRFVCAFVSSIVEQAGL